MRWILILLLLPAVFAVDLAQLNGYRVPSGVDDLFGNAVVTVQFTDSSITYKLVDKQMLVSEDAADYVVTINAQASSLDGNVVPILTQLYLDNGITVDAQGAWAGLRFWWASKWFAAPTESFTLPAGDVVETDIVETDIVETDVVETDVVETDIVETDVVETDVVETEEQTLTEMIDAVEEEVVEVVEEPEPENVQVSIEKVTFEPSKLTISVGETVDFTNNRESGRWEKAHLMGVRELRDVESDDFYPGETWSHTFTEPGRYQMVDMYITTMVITIVVEE